MCLFFRWVTTISQHLGWQTFRLFIFVRSDFPKWRGHRMASQSPKRPSAHWLAFQGWEKKRDCVIGPHNFQNLVRRTIQAFCSLAPDIESFLVTTDTYANSQPLRDFSGYLYTLDKCLLLLAEMQAPFMAGKTLQPINLAPLIPRDQLRSLEGFTPSKLQSLSLSQ